MDFCLFIVTHCCCCCCRWCQIHLVCRRPCCPSARRSGRRRRLLLAPARCLGPGEDGGTRRKSVCAGNAKEHDASHHGTVRGWCKQHKALLREQSPTTARTSFLSSSDSKSSTSFLGKGQPFSNTPHHQHQHATQKLRQTI
jgi:hypothetical protein